MAQRFTSRAGFDVARGRKPLRRMPALVLTALRVVWASSRTSFAITAGVQLLAGAGAAAQLLLFNLVLTQVLRPDGRPRAADLLPSLGALVAVVASMSFAQAVASGRRRLLAEQTIRHVNEQILEVAATVPLEEFDRPEFYDRLQRARQNAIQQPLQVAITTVDLIGVVIAVCGVAVVLVALHPLLLPLVLLGYAPLYLVTVRNSQAMYSFSFGAAPYDRARFYLGQVLMGRDEAKEVRAFGLHRFLERRWGRLYDERIGEIASIVRDHVRRSLAGSVLSALLTASALAALVWLYVSGRIDVAAAATAGIAMGQIGARLSSVAVGGAGALYEGAMFLEDLQSLFRMKPAPVDVSATTAARPFDTLVVEDVRFAYPGGPEVLKGVSLSVGAGEIVALVGENGSGKTTLAKLLCQLYRPSSGRILWDGTDTAALDPEALRPNIAVIFQDFVKYRLAAWENIGVGEPARADDRGAVATAAHQAGADGFLSALPRGYDTILSKEFDEGTDLSVGQWQRVALARAFFRDAPFIVLDEPTAALDARAEYELFQSIRTLCAGRSVLLISHRFSSVRAADRIYVLSDGCVVENGSHDELMRSRGLYAELFTLQASSYLGEDERGAEVPSPAQPSGAD